MFMKTCPQCGKEYLDDTLSFCLEDGSRLSAAAPDDHSADQKTAILSSTGPSTEAQTRPLRSHEQTQEVSKSRNWSTRNSLIAALVGLGLLAAVGLGIYRYYVGDSAN